MGSLVQRIMPCTGIGDMAKAHAAFAPSLVSVDVLGNIIRIDNGSDSRTE